MGEAGRDQAAINAQFLAANEEIRASLRVITEQLTHIQQRDRPNGPRPPARRQPYQSDQDSDADNMGEVGQDQVAINAQLLAANDEFRASLRAITEQLSQVHQRDRPNGPRLPARHGRSRSRPSRHQRSVTSRQ
ncbi:hypothetical protein F2Q69_00059771 [Brassica cretica]|uniref:Uncharacterized protein n=1 Tax=Brassica cretica TaxID=69181 RepID=A0A8S9RK37_BRACR|nr:hypothetical protein F2Q69_00059771 [Brassica cretica]